MIYRVNINQKLLCKKENKKMKSLILFTVALLSIQVSDKPNKVITCFPDDMACPIEWDDEENRMSKENKKEDSKEERVNFKN